MEEEGLFSSLFEAAKKKQGKRKAETKEEPQQQPKRRKTEKIREASSEEEKEEDHFSIDSADLRDEEWEEYDPDELEEDGMRTLSFKEENQPAKLDTEQLRAGLMAILADGKKRGQLKGRRDVDKSEKSEEDEEKESEESEEDRGPQCKTVFVGGVPSTATKADIRKFFHDNGCGRMTDVRIINHNNVKDLVVAFVDFSTVQGADKATYFNGYQFMGKTLHIKLADNNEKQAKTYSVFVQMLSPDTTEGDLQKDCGRAVSIRIPIHQDTRQRKGFAFVEFASLDAVQKALELDQEVLDGAQVTVSVGRETEKVYEEYLENPDKFKSPKKNKNQKERGRGRGKGAGAGGLGRGRGRGGFGKGGPSRGRGGKNSKH